MTIICRLLELSPESASQLQTDAERLPDIMKSGKNPSDVYRYWHAIEYLLAQHSPAEATARWLSSGIAVSAGSGEIPPARLVSASEVAQLDRLIQGIAPDDLIPHYDAVALDAAAVYPGTWEEWEESFDPLGQVLEHYSFLQFRVRSCAEAGNPLLLVFEELAEGAV